MGILIIEDFLQIFVVRCSITIIMEIEDETMGKEQQCKNEVILHT